MPIRRVYQRLLAHHGPQHWWPAETPFEVMVGAVLTQNTAWSNVEKAITNLRAARALTAEAITAAPHAQLAEWLRPSGYFNVKAKRLRSYCEWYLERGGLEVLSRLPTPVLREAILLVKGVGPETADDIVLYAFERPVFVVDAYTRRLFVRLGAIGGNEKYEALRARFETALQGVSDPVRVFNEYHALVVAHAKQHCRKASRCAGCCLAELCPTAERGV